MIEVPYIPHNSVSSGGCGHRLPRIKALDKVICRVEEESPITSSKKAILIYQSKTIQSRETTMNKNKKTNKQK